MSGTFKLGVWRAPCIEKGYRESGSGHQPMFKHIEKISELFRKVIYFRVSDGKFQMVKFI